MKFEKKESSVFRVARGESGQWEVIEAGVDKPRASFNTRQGARDHARDLAKAGASAPVKVFS